MKRFMLMEHQKNCWVVTIWSDGQLRIETKYKRRVNQAHVLDSRAFDYKGFYMTLPKYVWDMVMDVIGEYVDYKVSLEGNGLL